MEKIWPCTINEFFLIPKDSERQNPPGGGLVGFPQQGKGDRSLYCDLYDRCLDLAANRDWIGFDCRSCSYPKKGRIDFHIAEFADVYDEPAQDEIFFSNESEIEHLITYPNQEDLLITLIDKDMAE